MRATPRHRLRPSDASRVAGASLLARARARRPLSRHRAAPDVTKNKTAAASSSTSSSPPPSTSLDAASLASAKLLVEEVNGKRTMIFLEGGGVGESRVEVVNSSSSDDDDERASTRFSVARLSDPLVRRARAALLPRGFPSSVTPDYLEYQLASLPVHVTGWISSSLATSALLAAATVSSSPSTHEVASSTPPSAAASTTAVAAIAATAASSAAVKWAAKDGLGAAGRLLSGSRFGTRIDDDPRRWRLVGEATTTLALALDILTPLASSRFGVPFLAIAGAAAFASAAAKGVARPAARVIQTHFASRSGNVGDVAAKEEVWEVVGQVVGLACGVVVLNALLLGGGGGDQSSVSSGGDRAPTVAAAWLLFQGAHVLLRVRALRSLRFDSLNHKRGCYVASAFVRRELFEGGEEESKGDDVDRDVELSSPFLLPTPEEAAVVEPLLASPTSVSPRVTIGTTVEEAFPSSSSPSTTNSRPPRPPLTLLDSLAAHGQGAKHALSWSSDKGGKAVLLSGATPEDALAVILQCAFLEAKMGGGVDGGGTDSDGATAADLRESWEWTRERLPRFLEEARLSGWVSGAGAGLLAGAARLSVLANSSSDSREVKTADDVVALSSSASFEE